jgi:uncharacterized membrane protein YfcA
MDDISEIKNQLKTINIIHLSLMAGMVLFFVVVIVFMQSNEMNMNKDLDKIFTIIIPVYGLIAMFIARLIFNLITSNFSTGTNLEDKIVKYRSAKIVSWALLESGCILSLVATMLTSNYLYIVVFIFLLGYFYMLRPSRQSLIKDLQLDSKEKDIIMSK